MTLRLRDTLTREVRPIEPLEPGRVRMYTCGPTVYRYAHVGNLRSYLLADLIRRVGKDHDAHAGRRAGQARQRGLERGRILPDVNADRRHLKPSPPAA